MSNRFLLLLCGFTVLFRPNSAYVHDKYPDLIIVLVVPSPRRNQDVAVRVYTASLSQTLNNQITVVNRTGGDGFQTSIHAAHAMNGSYSTLIVGTGVVIAMSLISIYATYDPLKDLIYEG